MKLPVQNTDRSCKVDVIPPTETGNNFYDPLLNKIANSFGFYNKEASSLIQKVYADVKSNTTEQELGMSLAKDIVYKCIFTISSRFFSQNTPGETTFHLSNIPLGYRAVFILHNHIGFSETEISELLNIPRIRVRERLNKAILFNKHF